MAQYRYRLCRRWDCGEGLCLWVMLNPSKATATKDDNTITRCIAFSKSWGYQRMAVVNLSPLRATNPKELRPVPVDMFKKNLRVVRRYVDKADAVVLAYGSDVVRVPEAERVLAYLRNQSKSMWCLVINSDGHPRHPAARGPHSIPSDTELQPYYWPER